MAAPKRNRGGSEEVRKRIQTTQLLNRLQDNGLGKLKIELSVGQIRSIDILLRKTIPDLSSVDLTGGADGALVAFIMQNRPAKERA